MKIPRTTLLAILKLVKPACAGSKNLIEELGFFWFDGEHLSTYNDVIGIRTEFKTDFTGGLDGDKLIQLLDKSRARDVVLEKAEDDNLNIKAGSARIRLALRPIKDWFWEPEIPKTKSYVVAAEFLKAVELVMLSVGTGKIGTSEQRGVTLINNGDYTDLYTTDTNTISRVAVELGDNNFDRIILPTIFCEQINSIVGVGSTVFFTEDSVYCTGQVLVEGSKTEFLLFGKLVEDDNVVDFQGVVDKYVGNSNGGFPVPSRLGLCLERAGVLLEGEEPVECQVEDSKLFVFAQSQNLSGDVDDVIKLEGADKHPNITVKADPGLFKRGLSNAQSVAITKDCIVIKGPIGYVHIIANKD